MTVLTVIELSSQDRQRYWPKGQVDFAGSTASCQHCDEPAPSHGLPNEPRAEYNVFRPSELCCFSWPMRRGCKRCIW